MLRNPATSAIRFLPVSAETAIGQARSAGVVMAIGATVGGIIGAGSFVMPGLFSSDDHGALGLIGMIAGGIAGTLFGVTVAPIIVWIALRTVALRTVIAWTASGTIAGLIAGIAMADFEAFLIAPVVGFLVGALTLHLFNRWHWPLGERQAALAACCALIAGGLLSGRLEERSRVRRVLDSLPSGVRVEGCMDQSGFRDSFSVCKLAFDPADLAKLVARHPPGASGLHSRWEIGNEDHPTPVNLRVAPSRNRATLSW